MVSRAVFVCAPLQACAWLMLPWPARPLLVSARPSEQGLSSSMISTPVSITDREEHGQHPWVSPGRLISLSRFSLRPKMHFVENSITFIVQKGKINITLKIKGLVLNNLVKINSIEC